MSNKMKLIDLLIEKDYFQDEKEAKGYIMAGKVYVKNEIIDKPGTLVDINSEIKIKDLNKKYVGRGGIKLEWALKSFDIEVENKVIIDAGASTGGFTDCLIKHGAKMVYAVDAGYGQLAGKLRNNDKVKNMEKTNISEVNNMNLNPTPEMATVDLSYLSLKKAIPIFEKIISEDGEMICLIKPLFEVEDSEIRRKGKIKRQIIYKKVLINLIDHIKNIHDLRIRGLTHSPIKGNRGTKEFFVFVSKNKELSNMKNIKNKVDQVINSILGI